VSFRLFNIWVFDGNYKSPCNNNLSSIPQKVKLKSTNQMASLKSLPGANTLAYFGAESLTKKTNFTTLGPVDIVMKLFMAVIYDFSL
jgi:hypothetical protein